MQVRLIQLRSFFFSRKVLKEKGLTSPDKEGILPTYSFHSLEFQYHFFSTSSGCQPTLQILDFQASIILWANSLKSINLSLCPQPFLPLTSLYKCWVGQKVHSGFYITSYGNPKQTFWPTQYIDTSTHTYIHTYIYKTHTFYWSVSLENFINIVTL